MAQYKSMIMMTMMLYTFNKLINAVLSANETESANYNMLSYNDL